LTFGLCGCSPQRFFYYPNAVLYNNPETLKIPYALVYYPSLNGKKLYAFYFPAPTQKPLGVIVHFHGNYGNVSNHFPLAIFLTHFGFDVLSFDYEGYGESAGRPTMKNVIEDGEASVLYAYDHRRSEDEGVGIFGQSLGGAVGAVVAAKMPGVRAVVLESAFSSYRLMAQVALKRHWWMMPAYPMTYLLSKAYDPLPAISHISPRPLLLVHGDADTIVPVEMSKKLYDAAWQPKELWIVPGAGHLEAHRKLGKVYEEKIAQFFIDALQVPKKTR
jgi:hypothetical protein